MISPILAPEVKGANRSLPPNVYAHGFSYRKRAIVRRFLGGSSVCFIRNAKSLPEGSTLLLWGSAAAPVDAPKDVQLIRLEDGFLRSVGLGADLTHPLSWVIDQRGIYYDATRPSDLEYLLSSVDFDDDLLARAANLRDQVVKHGLTKYNVGQGRWARPLVKAKLILVPGQVETDASLRFGAPGIRSNMGLLQAVRSAHPDAYIVYKPHPDVVGLRAQGQGEGEALQWCDEVVVDIAMGEMLAAVDEVHVLTSLAGFEALLRGLRVNCYGQPFYAGWGLTKDVLPIARRTRILSLDALVAGALILYPTYIRRDGYWATPEQALDELLAWREVVAGGLPLWRKVVAAALRGLLQLGGRTR
jgi:capsular polysaccharide export protein